LAPDLQEHLATAAVPITLGTLASAAALAWLFLLTLHGGYWRTNRWLPPAGDGERPAPSMTPPSMTPPSMTPPSMTPPSMTPPSMTLPSVTAVIPARNEADILPESLPTLLAQDYQGRFRVVVVDDDSTDGTAKIAAAMTGPKYDVAVVGARPTPPGWAGKVWAMSEGTQAAVSDYLLFTDADIAYAPGTLSRLVRAATDGRFVIVSQMALLRTSNRAEKLLIPAFVYFFAQLYPFARVDRPRSGTAAAAGGCMLVRADALAAAGGLAAIRSARIDDVALGKLLKRAGGRCWLGLTTDVRSMRPYDRLADIWNMVARSAYTQLNYSLARTAAAVLGLAWLYVLPPVAALAGLALLASGADSATAGWLAGAGLAGWLLMAVSYVPMLRLYRLSPLRGASLPLVAAMYAAMTADSARRHHRGRGGEWKGRTIPSAGG
jgi:hopene-associated glycosyltransferase HpnB